MTEHDDAPTADQAEQPLSDDELDAVAGGGDEWRCPICGNIFTSYEAMVHCWDKH